MMMMGGRYASALETENAIAAMAAKTKAKYRMSITPRLVSSVSKRCESVHPRQTAIYEWSFRKRNCLRRGRRFGSRGAEYNAGLNLATAAQRQEDMHQLSRTWEGIKSSFFEKPMSWVLFALLCVTAYQWYAESRRLEDVCGLAREAIGITTPAPDDTEDALKQVERPSAVNGYSLRELWRWQQLDGPQINDLCPKRRGASRRRQPRGLA
jgi:hypothetical protein